MIRALVIYGALCLAFCMGLGLGCVLSARRIAELKRRLSIQISRDPFWMFRGEGGAE